MTVQQQGATYSKEEVAERNGKGTNECWVIYRKAVYNVTAYLNDHPGGADLILEWAGKDCTKPFDDFGHSAEALRDLKKYKIGKLSENLQPREIPYQQEGVSKENLLGEGKKKKRRFLLCR